MAMLMLALLSVLACATVKSLDPPPMPPPFPPPPPTQCLIADRINDFGFKFLKVASHKDQGNVVLSAYSVYSALALVSLGTDKNTRKQISSALKLIGGPDFAALKAAEQSLTKEGPLQEAKLKVANNGWIQKDFPLLDTFLQKTEQFFGVTFQGEDFSKPEVARKRINRWVSENTGHKISKLFPGGSFNHMTRMVLANAIYFKGIWKKPFAKDQTRKMPFHGEDGLRLGNVDFMYQDDFFRVGQHNNVQLLQLPYGENEEFSMLFARPKHFVEVPISEFDMSKITDVSALSASMNADLLKTWTESLRERKIEIYVPKFTVKKDVNLKATLKKMGVKDMFSPSDADFSQMTGAENLFISSARHKAHIEVDEEGTKAGAASGFEASFLSLGGPVLKIDRPFLFFIIHNECKSVVFSGKVTDLGV